MVYETCLHQDEAEALRRMFGPSASKAVAKALQLGAWISTSLTSRNTTKPRRRPILHLALPHSILLPAASVSSESE
jgi:hypothetical protein